MAPTRTFPTPYGFPDGGGLDAGAAPKLSDDGVGGEADGHCGEPVVGWETRERRWIR